MLWINQSNQDGRCGQKPSDCATGHTLQAVAVNVVYSMHQSRCMTKARASSLSAVVLTAICDRILLLLLQGDGLQADMLSPRNHNLVDSSKVGMAQCRIVCSIVQDNTNSSNYQTMCNTLHKWPLSLVSSRHHSQICVTCALETQCDGAAHYERCTISLTFYLPMPVFL